MSEQQSSSTDARPAPRSWPARVRDLWLRWPVGDRFLWLVVTVAFGVSYLAAIRYRTVFTPDSAYYVGMSLWFGGMSQEDAWRAATEIPYSFGWHPATQEQMFGWGLVAPRVVLPLLGVPFTAAFGVFGLAVVTGIAMAALVGVLTWTLRARFGVVAALVPVILVTTSYLLMYFGVAMLTESLTALWTALIMVAVWRYQDRGSRRALVMAGVLTVVLAFTRQATFVVAGAVVVAWLAALVLRQDHRKWLGPALVVGGTALVTQVLQMVLFPGFSQAGQFMKATGTDSLADAIRATPRLAWRILRDDLNTFIAADRPLLTLIALATVGALLAWRKSSAHLLVGALIGIALYNYTNGTSSQFRYAMPGLVFFVVAAAELITRVSPLVARPGRQEPDQAPDQALPQGTPTT